MFSDSEMMAAAAKLTVSLPPDARYTEPPSASNQPMGARAFSRSQASPAAPKCLAVWPFSPDSMQTWL